LIQKLFSRLTVLPRGVVILIDQLIIIFSVYLAYLLRFNFELKEIDNFNLMYGILLCLAAAMTATLVTKSYAGIVRYTGIQDGLRIIGTELLSIVFVTIFNLIYFYNFGRNVIPYSVVFISFFISSLLLYQYRLLVKNIFTYVKSDNSKQIPVVIFGAGVAGFLTKQAIESDISTQYKLVAFIDDDAKKHNKEINGTRICGMDKFDELVKKNKIRKMVIATKSLSIERKNEIVDQALLHHIKVSYVPSFEKWLRNEWDLKQIRDINIEDLLGREVIRLDNPEIEKEIRNKVICITGAAGSIGSELARQILTYKPHTLILVDQAESPLYEIERELRGKNQQSKLLVFVANICNRTRINSIFKDYHPEILFHAAAYKHVPLMESNPSEAVMVNIFGTRTLADLAVEHKVKKFVMISTDKAVNPTNVMGCTKRIAEI
jgi:FlaA1/EpsC-like NDP-sugar epimerase